MRSVQNRLSNGTMSVEWFNFVCMYVVQDGEPGDAETVFCVYALDHNFSPESQRRRYLGIGVVVAIVVTAIIIPLRSGLGGVDVKVPSTDSFWCETTGTPNSLEVHN